MKQDAVELCERLGGSASPPARGRGLKHQGPGAHRLGTWVAPRAGAWIETAEDSPDGLQYVVAPRAGAWIETRPAEDCG